MKVDGWEHGMLASVDRFADICAAHSRDNVGFVRALGDEYHIKGDMGVVDVIRGILLVIADEVCDEVRRGGAEAE